MAKWQEAAQEFESLVKKYEAGEIQANAIEKFVLDCEMTDNYYWRTFKQQLMEIAGGIISDPLCLENISQALERGLQREYSRLHFRSEDEMLDSLEEMLQIARLKEIEYSSICNQIAICFFALAWNGFDEAEMRELKKTDLVPERNVITFGGHEIEVSQRVMDILYSYAKADGSFRFSNSPRPHFYKYKESEYLFRSHRADKLGYSALRSMRFQINGLCEALDYHHRFFYTLIATNGVMKIVYDWEKKTEIMVTARSVIKNNLAQDILGVKRHFYGDLYTIVAKHYEIFRYWMDTDKVKIE